MRGFVATRFRRNHGEPARPGESGGAVTTTIYYMGVVHNATEAILTTHLLRNWLRVKADYLRGILIDAWSVSDVQAGEVRGSLRTVPDETFSVQLVRGYLYASLTLQGETGSLGWVELTQFRADEVRVFVWDQPESAATPRLWPAGTLGADLVDWLGKHYKHTVTAERIAQEDEDDLALVRELAELSKQDTRGRNIRTLISDNATKFPSYNTMLRKRDGLYAKYPSLKESGELDW